LYLKNDVEEMRGEKELHDAILEVARLSDRGFQFMDAGAKNSRSHDKRIPSRIINPADS
jgi:hypothetical protein